MKVILKHYVSGSAQETDMLLTAATIKLKASPDSNAVVVKNLFLSRDPYMLFKMTGHKREFFDPYALGPPITGYGVAKVLDSAHPDFAKDDLVWGITGWEEYSLISDTKDLFKIRHTDVPLSYYAGILACGAIGLLMGQFAKFHGSHVVGSVGGPEEVPFTCYWRKDTGCRPTKSETRGRIMICGMNCQYHLEHHRGIRNLPSMVMKDDEMQGYLAVNYYHLYPKYMETILPLIKESKVVYEEDISDGLETAPKALVGVFIGRNMGKQVVAVNCL
ncbi:hypothetical protein V6N12_061167 [Hibiscus sabdariffa]|uniref:Oxidoreductase N-terminal domain-containing protein n=1 Tax=Hibiscus sabdariffa TaxID=183260 RepID=A0ABR2DW94_9ROSI